MDAQKNLIWLANLPPGWKGLFEELVADLERLDPTMHIVDAKQKFGILRIHLARASPEAFLRIDCASRESARTCEECGASGHLYSAQDYTTTLCKAHLPPCAVPVDSSRLVASFRVVDGKVYRIER